MTRGVGTAEPVPVIRQYLRVLLRWRYVIIGTVVACCVLGLIGTLLMTPKYTASTTIEISRESDRSRTFRASIAKRASPTKNSNPVRIARIARPVGARRDAARLGRRSQFFAMFGVSAKDPAFNRWAGGIRPADGQRANASRAKYY
jgi:hypothetical protein